MSMSDCPKCWDTPCTCGYMGYTVTFNAGKSPYQQDQEKKQLEERIKTLELKISELRSQLAGVDLNGPPIDPMIEEKKNELLKRVTK